nr:DUF3367 domain-containing protein [Actinoplanes rectilineatus]
MIVRRVAALVTAVVLAPLALPGYVLRYDMVFVPRQPLSAEMIAPSGALPRAVPLDAVVSLANLAVPGWLLQRLALVAVVYLAALGAARLVPSGRRGTRVAASLGYAWTPFLAERLLIGQWALLLAYAMLPWLIIAVRDLTVRRPGALPRLLIVAAPAALTPTGGLFALAAVGILAPLRSRATVLALAGVSTLNLPWLVAALTGTAGGTSDPDGVAQFAARAENWGGTLIALAGTGGIWNARTVPGSRTSVLVPVATVVLLGVAAVGLPELRRRWPGGAHRLFVLAGGGFLLAAAGATPAAGMLEWLVGHVPGAGLVRDGQKFLIPYAMLLALCLALGAERLAAAPARRFEPAAGRVLLASVALLPVVLLPDLAFGVAGALRPVSYPADWDRVAALVESDPGEVLSLPFEGYRRSSWTGGVVVRDPAPRYLDAPVLMNDALRVGTVTVDGESPRAAEAAALLAAGRPAAELGVRWVLVDRSGPASPPGVFAGLTLVHDGQDLRLWANPAAVAMPRGPVHLVLAAHLLAGTLVLIACCGYAWYGPRTHESGEEEWPSWPRSSSRPSPGESSASSASSPPMAR